MNWAYLTHAVNSTTSNPADWFVNWIRGGIENNSGVTINSETAKTYSTVWQCLRLVSGDMRRMPLNVYRRLDDFGDRMKDVEHSVFQLLNVQANPFYSGRSLRETMQGHVMLHGNAFAEIVRDRAGRPRQLILLHPCDVKIKIKGGDLWYEWRNPDTHEDETIEPADMLHLRGLSDDGICGLSVVSLARQSFGLGLAEERHGASTFKNQARPDIILKTAARLDKQDADKLLANWEERHAGSENRGRPGLAAGGLEVQTIPASNNNDAQWLASREFQRDEIASWFLVPAWKVGGGQGRQGYNSVVQGQLNYINEALAYWGNVWEDEVALKMLTERERLQFMLEHNYQKLLQADVMTRTDMLEKQLSSMIITRNEARRELNMNSVEGGDEFQNPNTTSSTAPETGADSDGEMTNRLRAQLKKQLSNTIGRMLNIERNQVTKAASRETNFLEWYDQFAAGWLVKVESALVDPIDTINVAMDCSLDAHEVAVSLMEQSRASVVNIAGYSFPDNLTENLETSLNTDAVSITDTILESCT